MAKIKHTGGSWNFVKGLNDYGNQSPDAPILGTVVTADNPEYPFQIAVVVSDVQEAVANAMLISAAPDLLAALIEAKREMWLAARPSWTMTDFKNWAVIQQIDVALEKADGKPRTAQEAD